MELERLTGWLWCLRTPIVQAYAVRMGDGVALIDTSTAGQEDAILALLGGELGLPADEVAVHEIVLTHGHEDHTGSAAALAARTGARVLAPAGEAEVIEGRRRQDPPRLRDWEVPILERVAPQVPPAPPVTLDGRLEAGAPLEWELPAELVAAPGHTPGQLVVWFPGERVLVAGDAMASHEGQPMPGVFNVDPDQAAATYARLVALEPELACFGHGEALRGITPGDGAGTPSP